MRIKKAGGMIYGAEFTASERKAMNMEIQRQLAEYTEKHRLEMDALVLYSLHAQLGWGPKRLRQFYDHFGDEVDALVKRYEMDSTDDVWLCTEMLKRIGVDIAQWDREKG